jgi:CHASE3 domain sensor protein
MQSKMTEKNNDFESLSRLREIIFGEQMAKLEEEISNLSSDQKANLEILSKELNALIKEKEESFRQLLEKQKAELENQIKALEQNKADSKTVADTLRKLADAIEGQCE